MVTLELGVREGLEVIPFRVPPNVDAALLSEELLDLNFSDFSVLHFTAGFNDAIKTRFGHFKAEGCSFSISGLISII